MPNPWTGKGNPYTKQEVRDRLQAVVNQKKAIIAAGAGTGISAKFIEKGGADLIIIYNSGRFRMSGHGSTAGMMAYGDANAVAMEIGEFEVLPVVEEIPVICGVHGSDPRRRMWHFLGRVKDMGFSGVNNFPTHSIIDGHFRNVLEETGMADVGADAIIAHVGTTVGGLLGLPMPQHPWMMPWSAPKKLSTPLKKQIPTHFYWPMADQ